jgi:hypothetical protein
VAEKKDEAVSYLHEPTAAAAKPAVLAVPLAASAPHRSFDKQGPGKAPDPAEDMGQYWQQGTIAPASPKRSVEDTVEGAWPALVFGSAMAFVRPGWK